MILTLLAILGIEVGAGTAFWVILVVSAFLKLIKAILEVLADG